VTGPVFLDLLSRPETRAFFQTGRFYCPKQPDKSSEAFREIILSPSKYWNFFLKAVIVLDFIKEPVWKNLFR
jgi:hypothetical protein